MYRMLLVVLSILEIAIAEIVSEYFGLYFSHSSVNAGNGLLDFGQLDSGNLSFSRFSAFAEALRTLAIWS